MGIEVNSDELHLFVSNLLNRAFAEINVAIFNELVKSSGLNSTLNTLRPITKQMGYVVINMVKENMNIKGNGLDAAFIPFLFTQSMIKTDVTGEIKEGGAVGIVHDCIYHNVNASPEFCIAMSHLSSNAVCEAVNTDFECIWTHHLTNGDPYCRYIMRNKSDLRGLENLGASLMTIPQMELPKIDDTDAEKYNMCGWWVWFTQSFIELFGSEKTLEILCPITRRIGNNVGRTLVQKYPDLNGSVEAAGQLIDMWEGTMLGEIGSAELHLNDEFTRTITKCGFATYAQEVCKQNEAFYQGIWKAINPNYDFSYDHMMSKGDKTCHWTLRKKGEPFKGNTIEVAALDNPSKILAIRFAKGEITEEEFVRKMVLLKEYYSR
jgi:hypothetical protein